MGHVGLHIPRKASEQQGEFTATEGEARVAKEGSCLKTGEDSPEPGETTFVVTHQILLHTGLHLRRTNKSTSGNRGDSDIRKQHRLECPGYSPIRLSH